VEAKVRLTDIATLIKVGHDESERRLNDLRADFDQKHKENVERRHNLLNKIEEIENRVHLLDGRVGTMETHMVSIIGDNSGGSGLLHKMDKALDSLKEEVASIKQMVQNTQPSIAGSTLRWA
jgi:chromosome segregation ATPase